MQNDEKLTLEKLSQFMGYSQYYVSHKFKEMSGMSLRNYLHYRKIAFALDDIKNTGEKILTIAVKYGFSSHEAFTRSFKEAYGVTPSEYRRSPQPVVLHTAIKPFDCYLLGTGGLCMSKSANDVKVYFVTIPAHKFLHIRNYESIGYWDFWQKQNQIPGKDYKTVCALLDKVEGKLDDFEGNVIAYINEPSGRICSWGIPLAESYGVRLPSDYSGSVPPQMQIMDVPEGEYAVFEHGAFDVKKENAEVEAKIEDAMKNFNYEDKGYRLDTAQGRVFYFYHDPKRFWKYIIPVKRIK